MGRIAAVFGVLLIALGLVAFLSGPVTFSRITALIPAFFGLPILILGLLALSDRYRKHAMHAAAALGLIGFLVPAGMSISSLPTLISQGKVIEVKDGPDGTKIESDRTMAVIVRLVMALICAVFVGLCVKSFIDARRSRDRAEAEKAMGS